MTFEPIAIVGRSCVLPGALAPEDLWSAVLNGRDLLTQAPRGRWRSEASHLVRGRGEGTKDITWSDRGGYVAGFESVFDVSGFELPAGEIEGLDPLFQWTLHCARVALAGSRRVRRERTGLILGNLSFPSSALSALAESVWFGDHEGDVIDPRNRFMSGLPAHLAARSLGLGGEAFALDAACASSFYAMKLACDRLHDGSVDTMLAGAVNRADDLFIHVGFTALNALSPSGRSRPFQRDADGLVPAEGAALVLLKRLPDAVRDDDQILGVIRSIGLSNDGRGAGMLAPSEEGQKRALRLAYEAAGLRPMDVSLIECHATGTPVGDGVELRSTGAIYDGLRDVPIGSIKSNLGHLITVAGAAGLLKVLSALEARTRPPTIGTDAPLLELEGSPFRLLTKAEPWEASPPRRAALSAFGFGGNNAHVIVEEWCEGAEPIASVASTRVRLRPPKRRRRSRSSVWASGPRTPPAPISFSTDGSRPRRASRRMRTGFGRGFAPPLALQAAGLRFPPTGSRAGTPAAAARAAGRTRRPRRCGTVARAAHVRAHRDAVRRGGGPLRRAMASARVDGAHGSGRRRRGLPGRDCAGTQGSRRDRGDAQHLREPNQHPVRCRRPELHDLVRGALRNTRSRDRQPRPQDATRSTRPSSVQSMSRPSRCTCTQRARCWKNRATWLAMPPWFWC